LLVRENCGALDVGGACLGLLNAFAVAQSLIASGQAQTVAVVSADVHSRTLTPGRVAGEFGGLFGDGASAFILRGVPCNDSSEGYLLGEFLFGCAGQYASAIQVSDSKDGALTVQFDGEALSRAAITRMEKVVAAVELRSGIPRSSVGGFATHQPNPRLVALLAKQCGVSPDTFPPVARTAGNLGSSTCGAALHAALQNAAKLPRGNRRPIFLASLGPGLLFGGGWLTPHN
jgi:3-oxoacyl-[acyl-carrier-protein] synthase-3